MKRVDEAKRNEKWSRRGAASLDYVLTLGVLFAISSVVVVMSRSMMKLVYEMTCFFLAWPFM